MDGNPLKFKLKLVIYQRLSVKAFRCVHFWQFATREPRTANGYLLFSGFGGGSSSEKDLYDDAPVPFSGLWGGGSSKGRPFAIASCRRFSQSACHSW